MSSEETAARFSRLSASPGLCADCLHLRLVESRRSVFLRCGLADVDERFARYPSLPVLQCPGYNPPGLQDQR